MFASVSAMVWPVMVMQSPCKSPRSRSIFMMSGTPPTRCRSVATYLPLGLRSQRTGTLVRMRSKSSTVSVTPAASAIAIKWRTAFVEPPSAIRTVIAFSNALNVSISDGSLLARTASTRTRPLSAAFSAFSGSSAAIVDEPGRLNPKTSIADDIVFAVYIPPQLPAPGIARHSISCSSVSSILPALCAPTASKTLTTVRS